MHRHSKLAVDALNGGDSGISTGSRSNGLVASNHLGPLISSNMEEKRRKVPSGKFDSNTKHLYVLILQISIMLCTLLNAPRDCY